MAEPGGLGPEVDSQERWFLDVNKVLTTMQMTRSSKGVRGAGSHKKHGCVVERSLRIPPSTHGHLPRTGKNRVSERVKRVGARHDPK